LAGEEPLIKPPSSPPLLETRNGYYYGTTKGKSWWRRYRGKGWLSRGNSEIWVHSDGVYFRRYLTKTVKKIPSGSIKEVHMGRGHAGKWTGAPVIKIVWMEGDLELVSGFSVSWKKDQAEAWIRVIRELVTR
jgi:hypothetical protein